MNNQKDTPSIEEIFNLFSLFVFGTISFILIYSLKLLPEFKFKSTILFTLSILVLLCYEFIVLSILPYCFEKGIRNYEKHKKEYFYFIVVILALTYIISDTIKEESYLVFIRDFALIILTLITIIFVPPKIEEFFNKKKSDLEK
jgi:quinol-cytochrome oxidoreductase complex cytochrome b subunit